MSFATRLNDDFLDTKQGAYFTNRHNTSTGPLVNQRAIHDNAMPSANAAILTFFTRLAALSGDTSHHRRAQDLFTAPTRPFRQKLPFHDGSFGGPLRS